MIYLEGFPKEHDLQEAYMDMKGFSVEEVSGDFENLPLKTRDCYSKVFEYVTSEEKENRICVLNGLPGSGNTTLMRQAANSLPPALKEKALFITCNEGTDTDSFYEPGFNLDDVEYYIYESFKDGYRIFFIDEISYAEEFQIEPLTLSNLVAKGARIVVSGTNSFVFCLTYGYSRFDDPDGSEDYPREKMMLINTTYIPFHEYSRLTGCTDIREYCKSGGTFYKTDFADTDSAKNYVDQHVIANMIRSSDLCGDHCMWEDPLAWHYSNNEGFSRDAWRMICESGQDCIMQFMQSFLKSSQKNKRLVPEHEAVSSHVSGFYIEDTMRRMRVLSGFIPDISASEDIRNSVKSQLHSDFYYMGILANIPVYKASAEKEKESTAGTMTNPGLTLAGVRHTLEMLLTDPKWLPFTSMEEKKNIASNCLIWTESWIIEDAIIHEVSSMLRGGGPKACKDDSCDNSGRWYAAKLSDTAWTDEKSEHDIPVLIFDKQKKETYLFEIVHSEEYASGRIWHKKLDEFMGIIEKEFGRVVFRAELVTGRTDFSRDVPQIKIEDFLITMDKEIKKAGTAYELSDTITALRNNSEQGSN